MQVSVQAAVGEHDEDGTGGARVSTEEQDLTAQRDGLERSEIGGTTMIAQGHGGWDHHDPARS
jgi:hypothetical protein